MKLKRKKKGTNMWGGLIFAAKCGENCLMVRIAFSLKVAAKLPKREPKKLTQRMSEHSMDECQGTIHKHTNPRDLN